MLDRAAAGELPPKPHLVLREGGALVYEECLTRDGFDGPFSMLYHRSRPHEASPVAPTGQFPLPVRAAEPALSRRHYRCLELPPRGTTALSSRVPLLFNDHVVLGFMRPSASDTAYFVNADADELFFVLRGRGTVRSCFGDLPFRSGDYVIVPKGVLYRFDLDRSTGTDTGTDTEHAYLTLELTSGFGLVRRYRNAVGQLRMDAPYSHRDFVRPTLRGPLDEGIRDQVVKRGAAFHGFRWVRSPLDVIGWDGTLYPFVFPISAFQPRVGQVHLPPPVHATFEADGALVCSFVPRPLDFHERANPCPYPHSSVDVDEVLFYANAAFGSRRGIETGSLSHHPAGVTHGPHPGAYETPTPGGHTDELAVMLDTKAALFRTEYAIGVEDPQYHESFVAKT